MSFVTIEEAMDWINQQRSYGQAASLDKVKQALDYLGHPEKDLPIIHITGTNGKGSTTAFLRDLLHSQGLKVATFTSPHIMRFNERISYNGEDISDSDLLMVINKMVQVNDYLSSQTYGRLVFFELFTVMMVYYFSLKQPDVCLVEVGIGGYSDSTNALDGQIALITTIGLDHADRLGNSLESVAYEKSGIIKANSKVVVGDICPACLSIIKQKVQEESADLYHLGQDFVFNQVEMVRQGGSSFVWTNHSGSRQIVDIGMLGQHQVHNASLALEAFYLWMEHYAQQPIAWQQALQAIKRTQWMARMEHIHDQPSIYIDGAHNLAGLQALNELMLENFLDHSYTIIYAGLSTKNQEEHLPRLMEFRANQVFLTEFNHDKAMNSEDYQLLANKKDKDLPEMVDWKVYIDQYLLNGQNQDQLLLLTGSLYFVSEVRNYVFSKNK